MLVVPLPIAVIAYGAVHPGSRAAIAALSAILAIVAVLRTPIRRGPPASVLLAGVIAVAALALSALELVPVGPSLRRFLQPGLAELLGDSLALAGADRHPLAVAPDRALAGLSFGAGVVALTGAAAWVLRTRRRRIRLATTVVLVALAILAIGLAHRWLGWSTIWNLGAVPRQTREGFFAPFVSPNHAGAFLAAATPLAAGLATRGPARGRAAAAAAVAALLAGAWLTGSRGAVIEALVGLGAMLVLGAPRAISLVVLGAGGIASGLVLGSGLGHSARQMARWMGGSATGRLGSRVETWRDALRLVADAPLVGVGAGGTADAFGVVKTLPAFATPVHLHQEALQALVEHGLPTGILWIAACLLPVGAAVLRLLRLPRGRRRWMGSAYVGATAALAADTLWDFPLRIGALAVLAALVGGALAAWSGRDAEPARPGLVAAGRLALVTVALAALAGSGATVALNRAAADLPGPVTAPIAPLLELADGAAEQARATGDPDAWRLSGRLAAEAIRRRPLHARSLLYLARARDELHDLEGAREVLRVAARVYPTLPWPWLALARIERKLGDADAAREAWRRLLAVNLPRNDDAAPFIAEALASEPEVDSRWEALVPDRPDRQRDAARWLADHGHPEAAEALFERAVEQDRTAALAYARFLLARGEAERALAMVQRVPNRHCGTLTTGGAILLALQRAAEARRWFERARATCGEDDRDALVGLGRALAMSGDPRALGLLGEAVRRWPDSVPAHRALLDWYARRGETRRMLPHLEALVNLGAATPAEVDEWVDLVTLLGPQ